MGIALRDLNSQGKVTPCYDRPIPFTEIKHSAKGAAELCGRGTDNPCPLLLLCAEQGYSEGARAEGMVYGGLSWGPRGPLKAGEFRKRTRKPQATQATQDPRA